MNLPQAIKETTSRRSSEDRQTQIIETVIALAAERIPGQITTQDIADAIGFTQGALFRHFPSKEAIWLATIDWVEETLLGELETAAQGSDALGDADADSLPDSPLDQLRRVFFAHVDFVIVRPGVPRLIFNELQQPADSAIKSAVRRLLERYRLLLTGLLESAAAAGQIDRSLHLASASALFIGTIQGLIMQSMLSNNVAAMRPNAEQVFPLFLRSLKEIT